MEYVSRICVKVKENKDWEKLDEVDFEYYDLYYKVSDIQKFGKKFYIDMEWSSFEDELDELVNDLSEALGENCIIIADTYNIDVDPYKYCLYYFGDGEKDYYVPENQWKKAEKIGAVDIQKIDEWINTTKIKLTPKEIEHLKEFGIDYIKEEKKFVDREAEEEKRKREEEERIKEQEALALEEKKLKKNKEMELENVFYISPVGTQYENRPGRIENLKAGDEVEVIREKDNPYSETAILVLNKEGSLGHIPATDAKWMSYLIDAGILVIEKAIVDYVKPLSAFNNRKKKKPDLDIKIYYKLTQDLKEFYSEAIKKDMSFSNADLYGVNKFLIVKAGIATIEELENLKKVFFVKNEDGTGWNVTNYYSQELWDLELSKEILGLPIREICSDVWHSFFTHKSNTKNELSFVIPNGITKINHFNTRENAYPKHNVMKVAIPATVNEIVLENENENEIPNSLSYYQVFEVEKDSYADTFLNSIKYTNGLKKYITIYNDKKDKALEMIGCWNFKFDESSNLVAVLNDLKEIKDIIVPQAIGEKEINALDIEYYTKKINSLTISKNIKKIIFNSAFKNDIKTLIIPEENEYLRTDGIGLYNKDMTILYDLYKNPKNLDSKEYKIPDTVKTIGEDAAYKLKHMDAWA